MTISEFVRRRKTLMRMMGDRGMAISPSAPVRLRNRDVDFPYRQDSDFLYLTGFSEPESVAVLVPGRAQGQFILFCRERDTNKEIWHGRRAGPEGAISQYGADDAFPIADIDEILPGLLDQQARVYYTLGRDDDFDRRVMGWINQIRARARAGGQPPYEFVSLEYLLHDMRLYKSQGEISAMKKAAAVSISAHERAMRVCRPGMNEYEIEAELLYEFRRAGLVPAYPPIVGGGVNGCILHYTENSAKLRNGDLLLIDAAAEFEGYASDITRTFPVNGRFNPAQREAYELVLEAQTASISKVQPGNHWNDPHDAAVKVLTKGMVNMGLLKGKPAKLIRDGDYRRFYMHRTGHWLGLDVHDVGDYRIDDEWRLLEPGMTMTIEPGIYIPAGSRGLSKRWWNIGIRIEDDVQVTRDGHRVLTEDLVREPDAIEAFMSSGDKPACVS
ncbi:MAG TPA: aminopeptidase P N-terminal domain-containing protein [Gammaproteobacteria bacterium]|nr:aminopeptidase P N-terminal domain-containing protein [Gammaproteobacteria bacterium]